MYQRLSALNSEKVFAGVARSGGARSLRINDIAGSAIVASAPGNVDADMDQAVFEISNIPGDEIEYRFSLIWQVWGQIAGIPLAVPAEGSR